jgi:hypothetical protein
MRHKADKVMHTSRGKSVEFIKESMEINEADSKVYLYIYALFFYDCGAEMIFYFGV